MWGLESTILEASGNKMVANTQKEHRVGGGVTPAASHTTGHTVPYHGGSLR